MGFVMKSDLTELTVCLQDLLYVVQQWGERSTALLMVMGS